MNKTIWTIGHSTHSALEFMELLDSQRIETVVDVRSFPASRRFPHFRRAQLDYDGPTMPEWLADNGFSYTWLGEELGGRRRAQHLDVDNRGWRLASFRNYADYATRPAFRSGVATLEHLAEGKRVAYMCSEAVPWRCHRGILSDHLDARGWDVRHIMSATSCEPHHGHTWGARCVVQDGVVSYPRHPEMAALV